MTSNGRRIAFLIAVMIVFFLPKKVDCGYPGALGCSPLRRGGETMVGYFSTA